MASANARAKSPIEMLRIGFKDPDNEAKGTWRDNAERPDDNQAIALPSDCSVDFPVAITSDGFPFK